MKPDPAAARTIAVHAVAIVSIAFLFKRVCIRMENRRLALRYVIPSVIARVAATGLLLAVLHGIEAAAYVWLGALNSPLDAILAAPRDSRCKGTGG
jgi:hypothetical protein